MVAFDQTAAGREMSGILRTLVGIIVRVSYFLGLLSIFGQAARLFAIFDVCVHLYRKLFYWVYGFVLPVGTTGQVKDLITVGIFSAVLVVQFGTVRYLELSEQRAKDQGDVALAKQLAASKRQEANDSSGAVVGGVIIGTILFPGIGTIIGGLIGAAIAGSADSDADDAEARAQQVEIQTKLQFDLAMQAALYGTLRILIFSLLLGGAFYFAGRSSAVIEPWLRHNDHMIERQYDRALYWIKTHM